VQPYPTDLIEKLSLEVPLVGLYDAPDAAPFEPLVAPDPGKHVCMFAFYPDWLAGRTLHLSAANHGCAGAGRWLCGSVTRSREEFVGFLVEQEGLKSSHELMNEWIDHHEGYEPEHGHVLVGPLREEQYRYLKTVTFWVDADQLGLLILAAQYESSPTDPSPSIAPFGSGCMQLASLFEDLEVPQAIVGATDIAMRKHLEPGVLAFTVTKPMYERLCDLDEDSFLGKRFWRSLQKARKAG
jgi:hypothetical protein